MVIGAVVTLPGRLLSKSRKLNNWFLTYVKVFDNFQGWFCPWFYFKVILKIFKRYSLNIFNLFLMCTALCSNIHIRCSWNSICIHLVKIKELRAMYGFLLVTEFLLCRTESSVIDLYQNNLPVELIPFCLHLGCLYMNQCRYFY